MDTHQVKAPSGAKTISALVTRITIIIAVTAVMVLEILF